METTPESIVAPSYKVPTCADLQLAIDNLRTVAKYYPGRVLVGVIYESDNYPNSSTYANDAVTNGQPLDLTTIRWTAAYGMLTHAQKCLTGSTYDIREGVCCLVENASTVKQ